MIREFDSCSFSFIFKISKLPYRIFESSSYPVNFWFFKTKNSSFSKVGEESIDYLRASSMVSFMAKMRFFSAKGEDPELEPDLSPASRALAASGSG